MFGVVFLHQHFKKPPGFYLGIAKRPARQSGGGAAVQDDLGGLGHANAAVVQHIGVRPHDLQSPAVEGVTAFAQVGQRFQRAAQLDRCCSIKKNTVEPGSR